MQGRIMRGGPTRPGLCLLVLVVLVEIMVSIRSVSAGVCVNATQADALPKTIEMLAADAERKRAKVAEADASGYDGFARGHGDGGVL